MDCLSLPKLDGTRRYCFVAIDRATRLSYLAACESKDAQDATDFLSKCLALFPFRVTELLTDNGREVPQRSLTLKGFRNRWGKPMNGLTKGATTKAHRRRSVQEMTEDLHGWFVRYNFCRRHRRIGGKTPYEAALLWHEREPSLFTREPTALLAYRSLPCS